MGVLQKMVLVGLLVLQLACREPEKPALGKSKAQHVDEPAGTVPSVAALREAAAQKGLDVNEASLDDLVSRFPDEDLGVAAFLEKLKASKEVRTEALLKAVEVYADTAVGACALDRLLGERLAQGRDAFMTLATEKVAEDGPERLRRVALYRRALNHAQQHEPREAALDALRLWAEHAAWVSSARTGVWIGGLLRDGGYAYESEVLDLSPAPDRTASYLWASLKNSTGKDASWSARYSAHGPDVSSLANEWDTEGRPASERILSGVRVGSLQFAARDYLALMETYERLSTAFPFVLENEKQSSPPEDILVALDAAYTSSVQTGRILQNWDMLMREVDPDLRAHRERFMTLLSVLGAWSNRAVVAAQGASLLADPAPLERVVLAVAQILRRAQLSQGAADAYESYLQIFGERGGAPEVMLEYGEYFLRDLQDPAWALDVLTRLREKYPESPEAALAAISASEALFALERHEEGSQVLQGVDTRGLPYEKQLEAVFWSAKCLGKVEGGLEAAVQMQKDLLDQHRVSPVAPKALFWLADQDFIRGDYAEARKGFLRLLEEYPDAPQASQARQIADTLADLLSSGSSQ